MIAFWKKATILKSYISMKTRGRMLMYYTFSVVSYGCETWTCSKAIDHKINAFEMWCYRRMLRISNTNIDVIQKIGVKETTMLNNLKNRKLSYAGHKMRNTSGHYETLLTTLLVRLEGKRGRGRPRRTWVDDLRDWTGSKRYDQIKRAADTHHDCAPFQSYNRKQFGRPTRSNVLIQKSIRLCVHVTYLPRLIRIARHLGLTQLATYKQSSVATGVWHL